MRSKIDEETRETLREIGAMLRQARRGAGMSQAQLAAAIAMDRENYAKIERAEINVTVDTLVRIGAGIDMKVRVALLPRAPRRARSTASRRQ